MQLQQRMAALRAMADHPRSDPNEAALARAELARLQREHAAIVVEIQTRRRKNQLPGAVTLPRDPDRIAS